MVLYSAIVDLSRLFGPALAGLLVVTLGYGWRFAIDAGALHRSEGTFTVLYSIFSLGAVVGEPPLSRGRGRSGRPPGA